jgi:hypothetical protein
MSSAYAEISEALENYFAGFYEGDVEKLQKIFHSSAHLYAATEGPLSDRDMEQVYEGVRGRQSSASRGLDRFDRILSIDQSGPEAAIAKVQIALGDQLYTDFLNLLKLDGRWQIISKVYTGEPRPVAARKEAAE